MNNDELNIDIGSVDLSDGSDELTIDASSALDFDISGISELALSDEVADTLGIDSVVGFDIGETEEDAVLDFDASHAESEELSDAILIRTGVSVADTLTPYAQRVREALLTFSGNNVKETGKLVVAASEFPYMPSDVFLVFHQILLDIASDPANAERDLNDCAEESLDLLYNATMWTPKLNRPEYIQKFSEWCSWFRVLSSVKPEISKSDITVLMSEDSLRESLLVFEVNTVAFSQVTQFFQDAASMASPNEIDCSALGEFTKEYMEQNSLRTFTVRDGYNAINEYMGSEEVRNMLGLSQDEILEYSAGELLREIVVYELNNAILYPAGIRNKDPNTLSVIIAMLDGAIKSGSVVAEIIYIIGAMMLSVEKHDDMLTLFLSSMCRYFQAFLEDSAYVNPVFYGHVTHQEDGYTLSYAVGNKTFDIHSDSILCDVVGDKSGTKTVPKVIVDKRQGYVICPPPQLVNSLRQLAIGGRNHVTGEMCYTFSPTVNWLAENKVLAEEGVPEQETGSNAMQTSGGSLLQTLLEYNNTFDNVGAEVKPVVVSYAGNTVLGVNSGSADGTIHICCVKDSDGNPIAQDGTMLFDSETDSVIFSYNTLSGQAEYDVVPKDGYTEEYLGGNDEGDKAGFDLTDFIVPAVKATVVDNTEYHQACRSLCALAALDYDEELFNVQQVIARDLYYVASIPSIDGLLATRILLAYQSYIARREAAGELGVDNFNMSSFRELLDIVMGRPNFASGKEEWSAELDAEWKKWLADSSPVTVDFICERLDKLDFDMVALQTASRGELRRDVRLDTYMALRYIPEIGSRLEVLEDKMITMRVLAILGEQVVAVFSKRSFLVRAYTSQFMKENVDMISNVLKERSKRRDIPHALPLSKKVLNTEENPDAVMLKYFVLERNIYGLLSVMQANGDRYSAMCNKFLEFLGFDEKKDVTLLSSAEFMREVGEDRIVSLCNTYREDLLGLVREGLLNEVAANNFLQIVKAYDLFNTFYDLIVGGVEGDDEQSRDTTSLEKAFITYAGSIVISYAPVVDASAGAIDGGMDRFMAFVDNPQDFIYDVPIEYLRDEQLQDVRLIISA